MRVLAAMSGGVDSAVAAARAVDAGHDVVGVHLALSETPAALRSGSRGCCSREDAGDARRAADVLGIPFYVWDFAARFGADVVEDFVAAYARRARPRTRACAATRRSSSPRCWTGRSALGFDAVCTGHYARLRATGSLRRAVDADKDQSYVLAVLDRRAAAARDVPARRHGQAAGPRRGRARAGCAVADKPDSHDICFIPSGDTRGFLRRAARRAPGRGRRRRDRARCWPATTVCTASPSASAAGWGSAAGRGRPPALRAGHRAGQRHGHGSARPRRWTCGRSTASARGVERGRRAGGAVECTVQVRAHGGWRRATARAVGGGLAVRAGRAAARAWPRARRWRCTGRIPTATWCWAAPRSPGRAERAGRRWREADKSGNVPSVGSTRGGRQLRRGSVRA